MLILAGVSLNAVIGDNGIITQAQNATYMQSVAVLEEYLNSYYVEHYEYFSQADNKAEALAQYSESSEWIWNPSKNGFGAVGYIVDEDGKACYFINKKGLPEDIKNQLKGGDAGEGTYSDYAAFNDVYGITGDLQVYYCSSGKESILGIDMDNLDNDNPFREIFEKGSAMAKLITGNNDTAVTSEQIKTITNLSIDANSGITNLSELYNLTSLKELSINGLKLETLDGIQNAVQLEYLLITNCTINDYLPLSKVMKLAYFYIKDTNQAEVDKAISGFNNSNLTTLKYLGIYDNGNRVTNINKIAELPSNIKNSINYMYLYNNNIEDITYLYDFVNIRELRVNNNSNLKTLSGIKNMSNLIRLWASNCNLGVNEVYDTNVENKGKNELTDSLSEIKDISSLSEIKLENNINLKWVSYINGNKFNLLYLSGCSNLVNDDVVKIKDIYIDATSKKIDSKYISLFNTSDTLDYSTIALTDDSTQISALIDNKDVIKLSLATNSNLTDIRLNEVLKTLSNMEYLCLNGCTQLTSLEFIKYMPNLIELDIRGTSITDLTLLNTYASKLNLLVIDNTNIDLANIYKTCEKIGNRSGSGYWLKNFYGVIAFNGILETLNNTEITNLRYGSSWYDSIPNIDIGTVDLSGCSKLSKMYISQIHLGNMKLPSGLINLDVPGAFYHNYDFSACNNIQNIYFEQWIPTQSQEKFDTMCYQLRNCKNLNKLEIMFSSNQISNLDSIEYLKDSGLKIFKMYSDRDERKHLKDCNALNEISTLTEININYQLVEEIDDFSNLQNLEIFNAEGNKIAALKFLENCKNLNRINLQKNCIYDTSSYYNDSGEQITYSNVDLLINLNKNGNLRNLYLQGNAGITKWDKFAEITNWEGKSGW